MVLVCVKTSSFFLILRAPGTVGGGTLPLMCPFPAFHGGSGKKPGSQAIQAQAMGRYGYEGVSQHNHQTRASFFSS